MGWFDNRWLSGTGSGWVAHFDNTEWEANVNATWNGTAWVLGGAGLTGGSIKVKTGATWAVGYRPTKVRWTFTFTGDASAVKALLSPVGETNFVDYTTVTSGQEVNMAAVDEDILVTGMIGADSEQVEITLTNLEFYGVSAGIIDLTVVPGSWWDKLRPKKFRMKFDNATADVSLRDTNGVEVYANATYASGTEVNLEFAGADISRLVVSGSGDITDIEFEEEIEKE